MPETFGAGGGFIDYNDDGWQDILLVAGAQWEESGREPIPALRLYRNNGDGTFTEVTSEAGLSGVHAYGFGVTVGDYDNDGDQDFYFTTLRENILFQNQDGQFRDVTSRAGLSSYKEWSTSAMFFDADNDGTLDLIVGNYVQWTKENDIFCSTDGTTKGYCPPDAYAGVRNRFYDNNGDGTFTERTEHVGLVRNLGKTLGMVELDFNRDGWPDIAVANDQTRNYLYVNDGDGTFTERGILSGIAFSETGDPRAGMGIDAGIVDTSGQTSVFVGNFTHEMIGVFRYNGDGLFRDRSSVSQIGEPTYLTLTFGLFLFDADLDNDLDLFAANGHIQEGIEKAQDNLSYRQPPQLFLNRGNGTFVPATSAGDLLDTRLVARGAAYADVDRDGDQDILITENNGPAHLWRNDIENTHSVRIHLLLPEYERYATGAQIRAWIDSTVQIRRLRGGSSYLSQHEPVITLGLGSASTIDSMQVHWPGGSTQMVNEIPEGREIYIRRGKSGYNSRAYSQRPSVANTSNFSD